MPSSLIEAIKHLLESNQISTHEEIKAALEKQGFDINQSKISRLLRKIGAIKITNEQKHIIYALPKEPAPPASKLILSQLLMSMTLNENLIVIHTHPGSASMIGRLLDHHLKELDILGTVAGDDTIFIAPSSVKKIERTLEKIKVFLKEN